MATKFGIAAVLGDVLLDPRQRPLHIHDVVRPGVSGTDAIGHGNAHPATVGEMTQQRVGLRPAHPDRPRSAGNLQQHGRASVAGQVAAVPDIGQVGPAVRAVAHRLCLLDVSPPRPGGADHPGPATGFGRRLRSRGQRGVVVAQTGAQRGIEIGLRTHVAVRDETQQCPGDRGERQRDSAATAGEVATQTAAGRVEHRPGQQQR